MAKIYRRSTPSFVPHKYDDGSYQLHLRMDSNRQLREKANAIRVFSEVALVAMLRTGPFSLRMSDPVGDPSPALIEPGEVVIAE
jgi:hypothetical protein